MLKWREQHIRKTKLPNASSDAEAEYRAFREQKDYLTDQYEIEECKRAIVKERAPEAGEEKLIPDDSSPSDDLEEGQRDT